MRTIELSPTIQKVSENAEKNLREVIERLFERARKSVQASFNE